MSGPTYHCEVREGSFCMWFTAPRQLLLQPDWEQLVWDETLRQAHQRGVIPIGSVMVSAEEAGEQEALVEGMPMVPRDIGMVFGVDIVKVTAEVMVGTSL